MRIGWTVVALLLIAATAGAQDRLIFDNGHMIRGKLLKTTKDSVSFQPEKEGAAAVDVAATSLDPFNFYSMRERTLDPKSAQDHLDLASYMLQHRFYKRTRIQARAAQELDVKLTEAWVKKNRAEIREGLAALMVQEARMHASKDQLKTAKSHLAAVLTRYPDTRAAQSARSELDRIQTKMNRERRRGHAKRETGMSDEKRKQYVDAAVKQLEYAEQLEFESLKNPLSTKSLFGFHKAAQEFDGAFAKLDSLVKSTKDADLLKEATRLRDRAADGACGAHINVGEYYLSRGKAQNGMTAARKALKYRPGSTAARALRARAANPEPYGWGVNRLG